jgi:hypothetical protein
MRGEKRKKKYKPNPISITELIALNSTGNARKMLKKYGKEDATGPEDLMIKITELYRDAPDKKEIEKQIAEMHPHKDFILKYCVAEPKAPKPEEIKVEPVIPTKNMTVIHDGYSNCDGGACQCKNKFSNACGCSQFSGFSGSMKQENEQQAQKTSDLAIVATVVLGVLAFGYMVHKS